MPDDFYTDWTSLYDLMIDWPRRLAREGPELLKLLPGGPVLDVACGTGQHVRWLADAGVGIVGSDISPQMLAEAGKNAPGVPLVQWSMSQPPPAEIVSRGPFAGLLCLGNSFPHVIEQPDVEQTLANFRELLSPGGRLIIGLKALAVLRDANRPFLPLARRKFAGSEGEGAVLFVRFYEFHPSEPPSADFHLVIIGHEGPLLAAAGVHHSVTRLRVWSPGELGEAVVAAGFSDVTVASNLAGRPWHAGDSEDAFVIARR